MSEDRELAGPDTGGAKDLCGEHHSPLQPVLQQSAGRGLQHACHGVWIRSEFLWKKKIEILHFICYFLSWKVILGEAYCQSFLLSLCRGRWWRRDTGFFVGRPHGPDSTQFSQWVGYVIFIETVTCMIKNI